jgi:LysM repeat protein
MSAPNPLIPQGSFQAAAAKGATNVRAAVALIVAIHVVFFGGLLLQGCKRDPQAAKTGAETNTAVAGNLALPPMPSDSLFYTNANSLPGDASTGAVSGLGNDANLAGQGTVQSGTPESLWQATNLTSPSLNGPSETEGSTGPMKEYTVVSGDSLGRIAQRNQTTLSALKKANPNVDPAKIRPGQKLNIPAASPTRSSSSAGTPNASTANASGGPAMDTYTVKPGDSLTKIAKNHGVTVSQLRAANGLRTAGIKAGQKLKIPARSQASNTNPPPNPTF